MMVRLLIIDLMADDSNFANVKHTIFKKWQLSTKNKEYFYT